MQEEAGRHIPDTGASPTTYFIIIIIIIIIIVITIIIIIIIIITTWLETLRSLPVRTCTSSPVRMTAWSQCSGSPSVPTFSSPCHWNTEWEACLWFLCHCQLKVGPLTHFWKCFFKSGMSKYNKSKLQKWIEAEVGTDFLWSLLITSIQEQIKLRPCIHKWRVCRRAVSVCANTSKCLFKKIINYATALNLMKERFLNANKKDTCGGPLFQKLYLAEARQILVDVVGSFKIWRIRL